MQGRLMTRLLVTLAAWAAALPVGAGPLSAKKMSGAQPSPFSRIREGNTKSQNYDLSDA